jgi:hypothetical protein
MLNIRLNVFETNSSSLHSFYIKEGFKPKRFEKPKTINVYWQEFNCDPNRYGRSMILDYIWTAIKDETNREQYQKRIEEILTPYNIVLNWKPETEFETDEWGIGVDKCEYFIPILNEWLEKPDLFLSAVLCEESTFYTGRDEMENVFVNEIEGFVHFIKGN